MKACLLFIFLLIFSCSTVKNVLPQDSFVINCSVKNCMVLSPKSKIMGLTPLKLDRKSLKQIKKGKFIHFKIIKRGYLDKEVYAYADNLKSLKIRLTALNDDQFQNWVLGHFLNKTNKMSRNLLEIQAHLINGQFQKAKGELYDFQKKYPNVSSSYTMFANLYIKEKKYRTAESYLLKAIELDKEDSTARRLLKHIKDY